MLCNGFFMNPFKVISILFDEQVSEEIPRNLFVDNKLPHECNTGK